MRYKVLLYVAGKRVDTFDNETINIEASVQNIKDIGKIFNEFGQSFTVPASANNNRTFRYYYNFDLNGGFDARVRHKAFIWVENLELKIGTIRLDGAKMVRKQPEYYKLSFIGNLADLKDAFGDDYLNALDLSAYNFVYNAANVKTGLTSGIFGGQLVFPLISTDKQWFYNSDSADITNSDRLVNIAWNGSASNDVHGINWTSLRPALRMMRILEAIELRYNLTFSRDFLGNSQTEELRLWLANKDTSDSLQNTTRITNYETISVPVASVGTFNNSTGSFIVSNSGLNQVSEFRIQINSSDDRIYTVQAMNNSTVLKEEAGSGNILLIYDFPTDPLPGSELYVRIITSAGKTIEFVRLEVSTALGVDLCECDINTDFTISTVTANISEFMPSMKVFDFVKSFFQFFNLTIVPNSDTDFEVKQLDQWYQDGQIYDVSKYVDQEEYEIDRPEIFKEIAFKFQSPKTTLAEKFEQLNNVAYGDLETKLSSASGETLDGEEFEIELAFEQMLYEKLLDTNTNEQLNIIYGLSLTTSLSETVPDAHFLYVQQKSISANAIGFINDVSTKEQLNGNVYMPSHVINDNKDFSTVFGSEINEHDGATIINSAYELYFKDYITDSFSEKRRMIPIMIHLPLWLMRKIKLNDRLIIDTIRYIINNYTMDITTGKTEFVLLNDIYGSAANDGSVSQEEESGSAAEVVNDPDPTPNTGKSFDISSSSSSTGIGSCGLTVNDKKYWDGDEFLPTLADVIYNEQALNTVFNGSNNYYKISSNRSIRINSSGRVVDLFICSQGGGGGSA
ncbi:MAG: hypothetical protein AAGF96_05935 [Bacteroidota bacterium]